MAIRSVPWQRTVSDAVSWHQDQAQSATIYILRETGPTGFLLKEEGENKKIKVLLGDPHKCTCSVFTKEKDLCKHICWILLKKFRVDRHNPLSFQRGLVEREINEVLHGLMRREDPRRQSAAARIARSAARQGEAYRHADGREALDQRPITEDDVCPICQDEMLRSREPVTYCRFGCAKSVHIKCMKVYADHQKSTGDSVLKCPLCREDFGQIDTLETEYRNATLQKTRAERADIHMGIACNACNQSPLSGKCYKCASCADYHLCQSCFGGNAHPQHSFQFRQKSTQRWRPAQRGSGGALPTAVISDLQNREITDDDYDTLLQLDSQAGNQTGTVPEDMVRSFHVETVRDGSALLSLGTQCRVCLRSYTAGQLVKRLPCRHKFHASCIDQWLLHEHPTCPVDGTVVWNPIMGAANSSRQSKKKSKPQTDQEGSGGKTNTLLEIPGLGVVKLDGRNPIGGRKGRPGVLGGGTLMDRGPESDGEVGLGADFQLMGSGISSKPVLQQRPADTTSKGSRRFQTLSSGRSDKSRDSSPGTSSSVYQSVMLRLPIQDKVHVLSQDGNTEYAFSGAESHLTNGRINIQIGAIDRTTNQKPPAGSGRSLVGHRPPVPLTATTRNHIASIPHPREEAMTPIGLNHHGSNSAPSLLGRRLPSQDGGSSAGNVRERGRTTGRKRRPSVERRVRSSSIGRNRSASRERLHSQPENKLENVESLFLGSPSGQLLSSGKPSSNQPALGTNGHHPRSKIKPGTHRTVPLSNVESQGHAGERLALAGTALDGLHLSEVDDWR